MVREGFGQESPGVLMMFFGLGNPCSFGKGRVCEFFFGLGSPYSFGKGRVWAGEPWCSYDVFWAGEPIQFWREGFVSFFGAGKPTQFW